jgi:hypothetical protein
MVKVSSKKSKSRAIGDALRLKRLKSKSSTVRPCDYIRKGWAYRSVWLGSKQKTSGGLSKSDLMLNRAGKLVSKKKSRIAKRNFVDNHLDLWIDAFMEVRDELQLKGFTKMKQRGSAMEQAIFKQTHSKWDRKKAARIASSLTLPGKALIKQVNKQLKESGSTLSLVNLAD